MAYEFTKRALLAGKSVVSSNKELVATHGAELLRLAEENGCYYLFEAAVGGGIPVLSPLVNEVGHNEIAEISGILNGTTNYILTRMFSSGAPYEVALAEAQAKGYAEADPTADVDGFDAARKIAILAALSTGKLARGEDIHTEGIRAIRAEDVSAAERIGCSIKLLGRSVSTEGGDAFLMVAPFLLPAASPLSTISDVYISPAEYGSGRCCGGVEYQKFLDIGWCWRDDFHPLPYGLPGRAEGVCANCTQLE